MHRLSLRIGGMIGAVAMVAAATLSTAAASSGNSTPIIYSANPPNHLAYASNGAVPASQVQANCIQVYGFNCYGPSDIRSAYNVPSRTTGQGQTIVIVDAFGSPTITQDLHTFDQSFGLPDPQLNVIYPGGKPNFSASNANQAGWANETSLDVEWSHAIAPGATIDLVVAASNYGNVLNNAVQYAVDNHLGTVVSMSYGSAEAAIAGGGNNIQLQQAHSIFDSAIQQGITLVASAGDNGATNGYSETNAGYPASDPDVLAVGGTNLFTGKNGAYQSETVWNDGDSSLCPYGCRYGPFGATGGAYSSIFPAPSYQQALTGNSMRAVSDVAYNASVYTGILVYLGFYPASSGQNGYYFFGGTSEGSPQWAGIVALANQATGHSFGLIAPRLYAVAANSHQYSQAFHDVTVGNNAFQGPGFPAGTGYDLPTGLGSPNVANLLNALGG